MRPLIDVWLVAFLGTVEHARIHIDTFFNANDAHAFIERLYNSEPDNIGELKEALQRFLGFSNVVYIYQKTERR